MNGETAVSLLGRWWVRFDRFVIHNEIPNKLTVWTRELRDTKSHRYRTQEREREREREGLGHRETERQKDRDRETKNRQRERERETYNQTETMHPGLA